MRHGSNQRRTGRGEAQLCIMNRTKPEEGELFIPQVVWQQIRCCWKLLFFLEVDKHNDEAWNSHVAEEHGKNPAL